MNSEFIPITKPSITDLEINYVDDAIRNGWGAHCYDYIFRFQEAFAKYIGAKHALATSSCTGAIHLSLAALGIGAGDEVILPEITWIASVAPVAYLGAKPVFVDILPDTWCIDPEKIKAAINSRTKAILPTHVYGNLMEMDEILDVAKQYGLFVIEDAAEALGSEYKSTKAGSMGNVGVFSFHGTKTMTTGEGGMLVTNNTKLFEKVKVLADHGRVPGETRMFYPHMVGYKYKMSNLQAAIGCAQLERIEDFVNKKTEIFGYYKELTKDIPCALNHEQSYCKNSYWMPTIVFDESTNLDRDGLMKYLKENNIDSRPFFYPLSYLPNFKEKRENLVSYKLYYRGLNLPSYFELEKNDVRNVIFFIKDYLGMPTTLKP